MLWLKLFFIVLSVTYTYAVTDAQFRKFVVKNLMMCLKEGTFDVELEDIAQLQQLKIPEKRNIKCFAACGMKRIGFMNKKGLLDVEGGYKLCETLRNRPNDMREEKGRKIIDLCSKGNEVAVSDGEEGCDRAVVLFNCILENAPKLGFRLA